MGMKNKDIQATLEEAKNIILPDLMPPERLASALGFAEDELVALVEAGELPGCKRIAGRWFISKRALLQSFAEAPRCTAPHGPHLSRNEEGSQP